MTSPFGQLRAGGDRSTFERFPPSGAIDHSFSGFWPSVRYSPCIIVRRYPAENGIRVKVVDAVVDLVAGANEQLVAQFRELAARKLFVTVRIEGGQALFVTEIKKQKLEGTGQKM